MMSMNFKRWYAHLRGRRYGASLMTATGRRFYVFDPRVEDINVADICRGLANECRYNGQTSVDLDPEDIFYSVAEHSVIVSCFVERIAPPGCALAWAREGLLHDASEAYTGDMIRPIKYIPAMKWFRRAENYLQNVIFDRFGVEPTDASAKAVKWADDAILVDETALRCNVDVDHYVKQFGPALGANINALQPHEAELQWIDRFAQLWPDEVIADHHMAIGVV